MSILKLENIYKEFGNRELLKGVNLTVHRGEKLALVGDNGTGKTTLLKIAMGLETADRGDVIIGKGVRVGYLTQNFSETVAQGTSQTALSYEKVARLEREMRELEAEMVDEKREEKIGQLMSKYAKLVEEYEAMDGYNVETKIKATLLGLGLREEALTISIDRLSGGEKMRVALARILLEEPDLLILDEPTNHLDIGAVEWLENFLRNFNGGVLIVSHDRYFLDQVTTRVAELHNGITNEKSGNYSTYLEQKNIRKDFMVKERKRLDRQIKENEELVKRFMKMRKISQARSREKLGQRLEKEYENKVNTSKGENHIKGGKPQIKFNNAKHISKDIAWAEKLTKSFEDVMIFKDADFHIHGGEKIGIIGPNGCGKTTLLNILLGKDEDFYGKATLGHWVKYGYVGQDITFEDESRTIIEEIIYKKEMLEKEAKRYLSKYQFYGDEVYKRIEVLSGGERVRVYLATLMLDEPYCLILDEPTNHLDMAARDVLEKALLEYKGTIISISHDRYFLNRCVNRILAIENNKIVSYQGNYDNYKFVRKREEEKSGASPLKQRVNPKKVTKAKDKLTKNEDHKVIESKILNIEERIKELEGQFGPKADFRGIQRASKPYRAIRGPLPELGDPSVIINPTNGRVYILNFKVEFLRF